MDLEEEPKWGNWVLDLALAALLVLGILGAVWLLVLAATGELGRAVDGWRDAVVHSYCLTHPAECSRTLSVPGIGIIR